MIQCGPAASGAATPVSVHDLLKPSPASAERAKPFQLVKYFSYTSLVLVFVGTLVLSMFNTHWARALLREKSEEYGRLLIENLNHQVFIQFVLPVALRYGQIQLRKPEQFERLDKVVRTTLHTFQVETVTIYDKAGTVAYSFDEAMLGRPGSGDREIKAALAGETSVRLIQKGDWLRVFLGFSEQSRLVTISPLRAERPMSALEGPVLGAVEIVQDISQDYRAIYNFQVSVFTTSTLVMGSLFVILVFVVKRGEKIIEQRNQERLRLKEELQRAAHLSTLGEMVAAVSHEIRNPLGIIRSSAELLKKRMAAVRPSTTIPDIIVEESNRLNGIITDFLNYARPREPKPVPCQIDDILDKTLTNLAPEFDTAGCTVQRIRSDGLPAVAADADMLYQALLNLLLNAMQAMPAGGQIRVGAHLHDGQVVVCVEDEGPGLPPQAAAKIWDPFFTTKEQGTGLGLSIVRKMVESHGGRVEMENRREGGARAVIRLPLARH